MACSEIEIALKHNEASQTEVSNLHLCHSLKELNTAQETDVHFPDKVSTNLRTYSRYSLRDLPVIYQSNAAAVLKEHSHRFRMAILGQVLNKT